MFKFFVNPESWDVTPLVKAFETEQLRDEHAPAFLREVAAVPSDFSHQKYDYDFATDTWIIKPEWHSKRSLEEATQLRESQLQQAEVKARHCDMMGDATQAAAWRSYYRELYALEQAPGWPLVEQWPVAPTENER